MSRCRHDVTTHSLFGKDEVRKQGWHSESRLKFLIRNTYVGREAILEFSIEHFGAVSNTMLSDWSSRERSFRRKLWSWK